MTAGRSLEDRLRDAPRVKRPVRGSPAMKWFARQWDEIDALMQRTDPPPPSWAAVAALMVEDGVKDADAKLARQTYWRIKQKPPERRQAMPWAPQDEARPSMETRIEQSAPVVREPAEGEAGAVVSSRPRLKRVGE